eukprot:m.12242 g.12242  ORF g.12242 m.12242 type:complete len:57 (+) comp6799_c0_seq1:714-884(+)
MEVDVNIQPPQHRVQEEDGDDMDEPVVEVELGACWKVVSADKAIEGQRIHEETKME